MENQEIEGMNATTYKTYHESMMQNNQGSTAFHVFSCILFTIQCTIYSAVKIKNLHYQEICEYMVIVLPMIIAHTILSDHILQLNCIIFAFLAWELRTFVYLKYYKKVCREKSYHHKRIQTISVLRGLTYVITVFCILAVDFRSFPRKLAKTERFGYSLMDTGVGLFVLMSGIVHKDLLKNNWRNVLSGNLKFIVILTVLGIARYLSIKQLDYQEHVSEYGVHWNFFFTLAVCKFFSTFLLYFASEFNSAYSTIVLSFVLLIMHEFILFCGIQEWVFSDTPRESMLSANREGLSSCLGYVAMYLFGSYLKDLLVNKHCSISCYFKGYRFDPTFAKLIVGSIILWILTFVFDYFKPASRVLANASYCIFIESMMITVVSIFYFFEKYFHNETGNLEAPKIIDIINSYGLFYFMLANFLTGGINLSMRTFSVPYSSTFIILNVYMIATIVLLKFVKKVDDFIFKEDSDETKTTHLTRKIIIIYQTN